MNTHPLPPLSPAVLQEHLAHFTGTLTYYKNQFGLLYTDGIQYLAENAGAYWLIDHIACHQDMVAIQGERFQTWLLETLEDGGANLVASDGNGNTLYEEKLIYTDFPLDTIKLFLVYGSPGPVLMLTSEY